MSRFSLPAAGRLAAYGGRLTEYAALTRTRLLDSLHPRVEAPRVDATRDSWAALLGCLQRAAFRYVSKDSAAIHVNRHVRSQNGLASDGLEGFARTFLGLSFLHAGGPSSPNSELVAWQDSYLVGLCNGSNPAHPAFWGRIESPQLLVESAALAVGLMIAPSAFWARLPDRNRAHLLALLRTNLNRPFAENNWLWFRVMHNLALEKLGGENRKTAILEDVTTLGQMYRGDGWYHDGFPKQGFRHIDYYNAYAMHFYGLLFSLLQEGRYSSCAEEIKERASLFFNDYEKFFPAGGYPPVYGRSMLYRFASVAPWGLGVLAGCCPVPVDRVKRLCADTVNAYLDHGCVERSGRLGVGVTGEQPSVREAYSGGGSPYWAYKAFTLLLIPGAHSFWQAEEYACPAESSGIDAVAGGDAYLVRNEDQALLINPGLTHPWYALNYNRFAYSNCFPAGLDHRFPVDNMLLLRKRGARHWGWRLRNTAEARKDGITSFRWVVNNDQSISVDTTLVPLANGYLVRHRYQGDGDLEYALGGFSVGTADVVEKLAEKGLLLILGRKYWSALVVFEDCQSRGRFHRGGKGVGAGRVAIPSVKGTLQGTGQGAVGVAVLSGTLRQNPETVIQSARHAWREFVSHWEPLPGNDPDAEFCKDATAEPRVTAVC